MLYVSRRTAVGEYRSTASYLRHPLALVAPSMRVPLAAIATVVLSACGSSGGAGVSAPAQPIVPMAMSGPYTIAGVVSTTATKRAAGGVAVELLGAGSASAATDSAGRFSFGSVPAANLQVILSGPSYLTRNTRLSVDGSNTALALNIIELADPFSLDFYREFARDFFDTKQLRVLNPWTTAPKFYARAVTEDTGELIPSDVMEGIRRVVVNSVPELSGQRLSVSTFEFGTEERPLQPGWVVIQFRHALISGNAGESTPGPTSAGGFIRLRYDPSREVGGINNPFHCESTTVGVADHEIVHAMGFYHTASTQTDFQSGIGCPGVGRPPRTTFHAAIAYSRLPGNADPDTDANFFSAQGVRSRPPTVISCPDSVIR
jgi:hypothetical protein